MKKVATLICAFLFTGIILNVQSISTIIYKFVCIISCCLFFQAFAFCQTPLTDKNWSLDAALSDEFTYGTGSGYLNGLSANGPTSKWQILSECSPPQYGFNWGGNSAFNNDSQYCYVYPKTGNGYLHLKVDGTHNSYCGGGWTDSSVGCNDTVRNGAFNTGGIWSNGDNYSYGYFEMYAKLPGFIDYLGNAHADKFWPAFWMFYTPNCSIHNEIDIIDECCCGYSDAKTLTSGWGYAVAGCSYAAGGIISYVNPVPLCSTFHKYAVEWNTNRMLFYRDDVPYFEQYNQSGFTMNPQQVVIDLQLSCSCNFYPGTPWPQYMLVDYFHYYKLKLDCSNSVRCLTNSDIIGFSYAVKSSITFGDGAHSIDLSSCGSTSYVFRAVNGFTINGSFSVPVGYQLSLLPTACN
jgi:beta-glucanase (GH16 family)